MQRTKTHTLFYRCFTIIVHSLNPGDTNFPFEGDKWPTLFLSTFVLKIRSWNDAFFVIFYIVKDRELGHKQLNKGTIRPPSRATDHALRPKASAACKTSIA
jgi:hypothetical protein